MFASRVCREGSRRLSYHDLAHYEKVVAAIGETLRLMEEIDGAIPGWPLE